MVNQNQCIFLIFVKDPFLCVVEVQLELVQCIQTLVNGKDLEFNQMPIEMVIVGDYQSVKCEPMLQRVEWHVPKHK